MKVSLKIISGNYVSALKMDHDRVVRTATLTFREAAVIIKTEARRSIAAGGFSSRWQNALRADVYPKAGMSASPAISIYHKIKYAGQFEDPKVVHGHPLVWLPITQNLPGGRQRWTPALFTQSIGPLRGGRQGARAVLFGQVAVGRKNKPFSQASLKRNRAHPSQNKVWLPVFVGVATVNDPKRFDVGAVVERVSTDLAEIYSGVWKYDG